MFHPMQKALRTKILQMKEEAEKLENDEEFDLLTRICARLNFDFTNRVEKLEDFLMMDPSSDIKTVRKNLK
jgi:hypothetical protein